MTKTPKHNPVEDLWLIQRVRTAGSRTAFGELVEKYQSPLRRYLLCLTGGDGFRADDLAQETFIKAFTSLDSFRGLGSFRAWLFRIAYRLFLDSCRAHRPSEELGRGSEGEGISQEIAILHSTLACLDDTERHVILLSAVEQLSHSQIAKVTEMPLGTVKSIVARAKSKLREHLKNEEV